jgi:hypothetical protein
MKAKPDKLWINAIDIASANVALTLAQICIDKLVANNLMTDAEMRRILDDMIQFYASPGDPKRKPIRDASAEFARTIRIKYAEAHETRQ